MSTFNFDMVADNFISHLTGQLPWYESFVNGMLPEIASFYVRADSRVYDFGASTGNVQARINPVLLSRNADFIPIEKNQKMIENYWGKQSKKVLQADFTTTVLSPYSFATAILALCFVHPHFRGDFISEMKKNCEKGGAFLILEKFENRGGSLGTIFNRITWANKISSNQSIEMVVDKELGLSGVQFPLSDSEVEGMDLVYAYGDFRAYLYRG